MMIEGDNYRVVFDPETDTVTFSGTMRLLGAEGFAPLVKLLDHTVLGEPRGLTLDLGELVFLNSSGINVLSRFVIRVRDSGNIGLTVKGSTGVSWQKKSLKNLQRLMGDLVLEFD